MWCNNMFYTFDHDEEVTTAAAVRRGDGDGLSGCARNWVQGCHRGRLQVARRIQGRCQVSVTGGHRKRTAGKAAPAL